jgi:hypothetical protein
MMEEAMFTVAIIVTVLLAAVLVSAAMKPGTFKVQRTRMIHAGPRKIVPLIKDFQAWRSWSPYERAGGMEIIDSSSSHVRIKLDFIKPFATHNVAEFTLEPKSGSTNVTWAMYGTSPYIAKAATTFLIDRLIGRDFETGLANLKAIAEG